MWLFTSQFLADSNKSFFECSIIFQYLSLLFLIFFFFFILFFLLCSLQHTFYNSAAIQFHYNPHSTVRFQYKTPYKKYSPNCKQRFKIRKQMMRKLLQSFLKYFIFLLSIGSQVNHLINIYSIKSVRIRSFMVRIFRHSD